MATLAQALDADRKAGAPLRALARGFLILIAIPSALALAGCSAALVQRDVTAFDSTAASAHLRAEPHSHKFRALLAPRPPPDCEFKGSDTDALDTDLWARLKLDYERHCYQHAETIVRDRLRQLQVSGLCEIPPVRHRRRFIR
jgi:hypothetical protein